MRLLINSSLFRFLLLGVLFLKVIALEAAIESAVGNGNWANGSSWVGGMV